MEENIIWLIGQRKCKKDDITQEFAVVKGDFIETEEGIKTIMLKDGDVYLLEGIKDSMTLTCKDGKIYSRIVVKK